MTVRELEAWAIAHPNMPQARAVLELIAQHDRLGQLVQRDLADAMAQRDAVRARVAELEAVLRKVQQWDCLNPPRVDVLADLGWLKAVVIKVELAEVPSAAVPSAPG